MASKGGCFVKYGKVELGSNEDKLSEVMDHFKSIITNFGYPEQEESENDSDLFNDDDDDDELENSTNSIAVLEEDKENKAQAPWLRNPHIETNKDDKSNNV